MIPAMAVGALFGLGILMLVRGLVPPRTDLAAAVGRLDLNRAHASRPRPAQPAKSDTVGRWISNQLARRGVDLSAINADLRVTDRTFEQWAGRVVITAVVGFAMPSVLGVMAALLGLNLGATVPLLAGVVFATAAVAGEISQLRSTAEAKRAELLHALSTYLDLFSLCLAGGRGVPEAMVTSANIGTGWAFELIQNTIRPARRAGITPWEALGNLGAEVGLQELVDFGAALTLVGDNGAKVRASLTARSATLRRRQLVQVGADAAKKDDSMRVSQLLMGLGFMVLIGYPAVVNVLAV